MRFQTTPKTYNPNSVFNDMKANEPLPTREVIGAENVGAFLEEWWEPEGDVCVIHTEKGKDATPRVLLPSAFLKDLKEIVKVGVEEWVREVTSDVEKLNVLDSTMTIEDHAGERRSAAYKNVGILIWTKVEGQEIATGINMDQEIRELVKKRIKSVPRL